MKNSRKFLYLHVIVAAMLSIVIGFANYFSVFKRIDFYLFDSAHRFSDVLPAEDIVIIDIDEPSLAALGAWPWSRSLHAKVLHELTRIGIDSVAFDVIFSELKSEDSSGDIAFAEAISRHAGVVLPVFIGQSSHKGTPLEVPPAPLFYQAASAIGHVHIDCEFDAICRSIYLKEGVGEPFWPHISLALLQQQRFTRSIPGAQQESTDAGSSMLIYRDYENFILFPKAGHSYTTLSFIDVVNEYFKDDQFVGFTAFVGSTAAGLGDEISTPVGPMSGVIANAVIYQELRTQKLIQQASELSRGLFSAIIGFVILLIISRLTPLFFLVSTLVLVASAYGLMVFSLVKLHYWMPVAGLMILVLMYYPLWSWIKLQLALNFLTDHLGKLRFENLTAGSLLTASQGKATRNKTGMVIGVEAVTETLQQLDLLNDALDEHRFLIENTLTHLQEAVILATTDGQLVLANLKANQIFDINQESTLVNLGACIDKVEHKSISTWEQYIDTLASAQHPGGVELHIRLENENSESESAERVLYCRAALEQFDTENGERVKMFVLTFSDITPIKTSERSRLDTLNFLSHDLRAPMVSILALINNIESGKNTDSQEQNLSTIRSYTESNLRYSESILQLSRAEALTQESLTMVDVHSVIDTAYCNVNEFAKSKHIPISIEREDADLWVEGDAELLERALQNLLSNAIKYSDAGSRVTLSLSTAGEQVELRVSDNGIGIDTAQVDNIFSRYKRARQGRATLGAGLGLFFVKTVVQKHGGAIDVESVLGEGTTIWITLPLYKHHLS